jgi:hypothetical protein
MYRELEVTSLYEKVVIAIETNIVRRTPIIKIENIPPVSVL